MSIATETYANDFLKAEQHQTDTLAAEFKTKFFLDWFDSFDTFIGKVDRTDTISELQGKKASHVKIKDWSPFKLEGLHSLALEKAMRIRYSGYNATTGLSNSIGIYKAARHEANDLATAIQEFKRAALDWEGS